MSCMIRFSQLSARLGAGEKWTEAYFGYVEGAPQTATTHSANNNGGVFDSVRKQTIVVRKSYVVC